MSISLELRIFPTKKLRRRLHPGLKVSAPVASLLVNAQPGSRTAILLTAYWHIKHSEEREIDCTGSWLGKATHCREFRQAGLQIAIHARLCVKLATTTISHRRVPSPSQFLREKLVLNSYLSRYDSLSTNHESVGEGSGPAAADAPLPAPVLLLPVLAMKKPIPEFILEEESLPGSRGGH